MAVGDRELVVAEFDGARYPAGHPNLAEAWLGIHQVLWWYIEHPLLSALDAAATVLSDASPEVQTAAATLRAFLEEDERSKLLHIREANDLRDKTIWQERAVAAEEYLAHELGVPSAEVPPLLDRMMRLPRWVGKQRHNPLGNGLRMLVSEVLQRWGSSTFRYAEETKATRWFPGIKMVGRSDRPSIDIAITREMKPVAILSCKWSIRHDRISDPTNECTAYKAAAVIQSINLRYFVVTNELDGQRLDKVLGQPCVDALVHVHLDLARRMSGGLTPHMETARRDGRLLDLAELVSATHNW